MVKLKFNESKAEPVRLCLDLGAGKGLDTPDGFTPVDIHPWKGVTVVDLTKRWPWKMNSVDEAQSVYAINYLTASERVHFFNELYRVLKPDSRCMLSTPHWCSNRAYADVRAQWPPIAESFYTTLMKSWRENQNSVDTSGLTCDFEFTLGYGMHGSILSRNQEYQQHALQYWKETAQDLIVTLTKRK